MTQNFEAPEFSEGPWEIEPDLLDHDFVVSAASWGALARVVAENDEDGSGTSWKPSATGKANARLIAAAPEMYEALKKLSDRVIEYFPKSRIPAYLDCDIAVRQLARDALAVLIKAGKR